MAVGGRDEAAGGFDVSQRGHDADGANHEIDREDETLGALEGGVFYALHNDAQVAAFAWYDISRALALEPCR